jgi:hypothetical protein
MDFRDILGKFAEQPKINTVEETPVVESKLPSLKNIFESLSNKSVSEAEQVTMEPAKQNTQVIKQGTKVLGTVTNPQLAQQIKQSIGKGEMSLAGTNIKEDDLDEKWAGDAKIKPTGEYSGKSKEELKSMLAKLHKSGPHDKDSPAAKKMRQINFALRAKGGWKSGEGAAMKEEELAEKAKNPYAIGMAAAKKAAGIKKTPAHDLPKKVVTKGHEIAKKIMKKEKTNEADIAPTKSQDTMGAALGRGRSDKAFETKQVNEAMNTLEAAYHEGKSHGLSKHGYACKYNEGSEEHKRYHKGFVEGLDECYGMGIKNEPIVGLEAAMPAMEADMEEGNAFTAALAKADKGEKFTVGGKTFVDRSNYNAKIDELAFESLDKQLAALLEGAEPTVNEGLSVSMSTGQQGSPDSVSVTGTDDEAGKLLAFIKQVGLGGMGGDKEGFIPSEPAVVSVSDYGAPKFSGHNDMAALMKKVGADEDHDQEEQCNECGGMMEAGHSCGSKEMVDEVESEDQKLYATTSESDNSEDDGFDASARNTELDNIGKPAKGGATNEDGAEAPGSNPVGQAEQEAAEEVNEESTEKMDQHAEKAAEKVKKDIEYDDKKDREHDKLDEWANNAGQKGTDTAFEQDIEFMTKIISGGLNKPKVTGQTTIPVIAGQEARVGEKEDLGSWIKLAGIKPAVKK